MSQLAHIFMADVVGSREFSGAALQRDLTRMLKIANASEKGKILSPLTTTLGDEFQGVACNLKAGVGLVFRIEEIKLAEGFQLPLRYVVYEGEIDTPINESIAFGMLGSGLASARAILADKRRGRPDVLVHLADEALRAHRLNLVLEVVLNLARSWNVARDGRLIADMIVSDDNEAVGRRHRKNRSQVWKRRQSLRVGDYRSLRELAFDLATDPLSGPQLRKLRQRSGIRLKEAAERIGMTQDELSILERTRTDPVAHDLQRKFDRVVMLESGQAFGQQSPNRI